MVVSLLHMRHSRVLRRQLTESEYGGVNATHISTRKRFRTDSGQTRAWTLEEWESSWDTHQQQPSNSRSTLRNSDILIDPAELLSMRRLKEEPSSSDFGNARLDRKGRSMNMLIETLEEGQRRNSQLLGHLLHHLLSHPFNRLS